VQPPCLAQELPGLSGPREFGAAPDSALGFLVN
jgi:hypothetical protein